VQIDRMCVVELATASDLASGIIPLPYGFRAVGSKVVWDDAIKTRGKRIRVQRRDGRARYVIPDTLYAVLGDFDQIVFVEPPA
jgi:hypothetical protein